MVESSLCQGGRTAAHPGVTHTHRLSMYAFTHLFLLLLIFPNTCLLPWGLAWARGPYSSKPAEVHMHTCTYTHTQTDRIDSLNPAAHMVSPGVLPGPTVPYRSRPAAIRSWIHSFIHASIQSLVDARSSQGSQGSGVYNPELVPICKPVLADNMPTVPCVDMI